MRGADNIELGLAQQIERPPIAITSHLPRMLLGRTILPSQQQRHLLAPRERVANPKWPTIPGQNDQLRSKPTDVVVVIVVVEVAEELDR